ncbi:integral membrane sensor signal transduction histidine kinase (plasmid) [Emticicia oligotrophica DSM 17448]|uniref:histidine kinase n=1 Tax=Emticicia oligotrophica (strain DSM 17448 / CIP 109782 / MTCC 6937 / GPTSA100-15) TaxID=929562 RepID=A0ABM5N7R2_EMTOG|nr:HAMP domain-containing sensor histidine kinase [Emticicia oligotrophica]AFK05564.1 integral membrane sensor signal transduction histidine kinase [Emticicia oligotrophica DSM 17448]
MARLTHSKDTNLLNQTLKGYLIFSALLLLLFIPIIFFLFQKLYLDDIDDGLRLEKSEFQQYILPNLKTQDIKQWNRFNRDFKIIDTLKSNTHDYIEQKFYYDTLVHELEPYRVLYSSVSIENKPYTLLIKQNLIEEKDWIEKIILFVVSLLIFILLGTYLITRWQNRRVWRSFYQNLTLLERFELENAIEPPKFLTSNINEFNRLTTVLKELVNRVIKSYKIQREFAENAAHELQTPVAVLKSKIDSFLQVPELTDRQMQLLDQLNEATTRLSRLNKNLLLLSKLEHQIFEKGEVDFKNIIVQNLDFWYEQCEAKHLKMEYLSIHSSLQMANLSLAEILINNLIFNAIRHNILGGNIEIFLNHEKFVVRNSGKNEAIPSNQLFQRFVKTDASTQGNGLGLAIVKKITDLHSWKIEYSFENNLHIFTIFF